MIFGKAHRVVLTGLKDRRNQEKIKSGAAEIARNHTGQSPSSYFLSGITSI